MGGLTCGYKQLGNNIARHFENKLVKAFLKLD